jgi:ribosomal protein S27AE
MRVSKLTARLLNNLDKETWKMGTFTKHRCPRCGGNMFLYNDYDGWYEQCLQCSFINYLDVIYQNNKEKVDSPQSSEIHQAAAS